MFVYRHAYVYKTYEYIWKLANSQDWTGQELKPAFRCSTWSCVHRRTQTIACFMPGTILDDQTSPWPWDLQSHSAKRSYHQRWNCWQQLQSQSQIYHSVGCMILK